jgi:hypothetical protein
MPPSLPALKSRGPGGSAPSGVQGQRPWPSLDLLMRLRDGADARAGLHLAAGEFGGDVG